MISFAVEGVKNALKNPGFVRVGKAVKERPVL
jgi:hypothetical protein